MLDFYNIYIIFTLLYKKGASICCRQSILFIILFGTAEPIV